MAMAFAAYHAVHFQAKFAEMAVSVADYQQDEMNAVLVWVRATLGNDLTCTRRIITLVECIRTIVRRVGIVPVFWTGLRKEGRR